MNGLTTLYKTEQLYQNETFYARFASLHTPYIYTACKTNANEQKSEKIFL